MPTLAFKHNILYVFANKNKYFISERREGSIYDLLQG